MATKRGNRSKSSISVSKVVAGKTLADRPVNLDGKREPLIRLFKDNPGLMVVDHFAGGGGASSGVTSAFAKLGLNREPDIAINHDPEAIAMHKVNHPKTKHYIDDIFKVKPKDALKSIGGDKIGLLWASPTCTFFSRARGGPLSDKAIKIRGLCWVITSWAATVDIDCICAENVSEFMKFGPLHRTHSHGCSKEYAKTDVWDAKKKKKIARGCMKKCHYLTPIKGKEGTLYRAFIRRLEKLGYVVETRVLEARAYGAPTTRKRWFMVARKDKRPIVWPAATHGVPGSGLHPYLTTAEDVIDWSLKCRSIFGRKKPLRPKTLARIARGVDKYVLTAAKPFIVPTSYGDKGGSDVRVGDIDEALRTVAGNRSSMNLVDPMVLKVKTYGGGGNDAKSVNDQLGTVLTSKRGEHALAGAVIVRTAHGEIDKTGKKRGQGAHSVEESLHTVCASSKDYALAEAIAERVGSFIAPNNTNNVPVSVEGQTPTATTGGRNILAEAIAVPYMIHRSNGERAEFVRPDGTVIAGQAPRIYDVQGQHPTAVSGGIKTGLSLAYLVKHNGGNNDRNGGMSGQDLRRELDTVSCRDTKALASIEAVHISKLRGTSKAHINASAKSVEEPLDAVAAQGTHYAKVAAYLVRYNGTGGAETVEAPMGTGTTKHRFGLVEVSLSKEITAAALQVAKFLGYDKPLIVVINGEQWVLVDIAMRMLVARELFNAQSFAKTYKIDFDENGKPFTETAKVRMCGNSVPPKIAEALVMAQLEAA